MTSASSIREKIDELRLAVKAGALSRERALDALALNMSSVDSDNPAFLLEESHRGGAVHVCPWHTCQATRHG